MIHNCDACGKPVNKHMDISAFMPSRKELDAKYSVKVDGVVKWGCGPACLEKLRAESAAQRARP